MKITVENGKLSQMEINSIIAVLKKENPDKMITELVITVDGEYLDLDYKYEIIPIDRIRRITGYLVGTIDRFNDAKRAEVEDRVKHNI